MRNSRRKFLIVSCVVGIVITVTLAYVFSRSECNTNNNLSSGYNHVENLNDMCVSPNVNNVLQEDLFYDVLQEDSVYDVFREDSVRNEILYIYDNADHVSNYIPSSVSSHVSYHVDEAEDNANMQATDSVLVNNGNELKIDIVDENMIINYLNKTKDTITFGSCSICMESILELDENLKSVFKQKDDESFIVSDDNKHLIFSLLKTKCLISSCDCINHVFHPDCFFEYACHLHKELLVDGNIDVLWRCTICNKITKQEFVDFVRNLLNLVYKLKDDNPEHIILKVFKDFVSKTDKSILLHIFKYDKMNVDVVKYLCTLIDDKNLQELLYNEIIGFVNRLHLKNIDDAGIINKFIKGDDKGFHIYDEFMDRANTDAGHLEILKYIKIETESNKQENPSNDGISFIDYCALILDNAQEYKRLKLAIFYLFDFVEKVKLNIISFNTKKIMDIVIKNIISQSSACEFNDILETPVDFLLMKKKFGGNKYLSLDLHEVEILIRPASGNVFALFWSLEVIIRYIKFNNCGFDDKLNFFRYICELSKIHIYSKTRIILYGLCIIKYENFTFNQIEELVYVVSNIRPDSNLLDHENEEEPKLIFIRYWSGYNNVGVIDLYKLVDIVKRGLNNMVLYELVVNIINKTNDLNSWQDILRYIELNIENDKYVLEEILDYLVNKIGCTFYDGLYMFDLWVNNNLQSVEVINACNRTIDNKYNEYTQARRGDIIEALPYY